MDAGADPEQACGPDRVEDSLACPIVLTAVMPLPHGLPGTEFMRKVAPWGSGSVAPGDPFQRFPAARSRDGHGGRPRTGRTALDDRPDVVGEHPPRIISRSSLHQRFKVGGHALVSRAPVFSFTLTDPAVRDPGALTVPKTLHTDQTVRCPTDVRIQAPFFDFAYVSPIWGRRLQDRMRR